MSSVGPSLDVNGDGQIPPLDALAVINELNSGAAVTAAVLSQYDINQDGIISPLDALAIINYLNSGAVQTSPAVASPAVASSSAATAAVAAAAASGTTSAPAVDEELALPSRVGGNFSSQHAHSVDGVFGSYPDELD